ncbi:arginase family protein [Chitinophaga sp. 22620]|uniref:arginase family protein n=1 Tax=Chitinophaga sp. 22620 TaxID=3453952 RepID=UPI003F87F4FC
MKNKHITLIGAPSSAGAYGPGQEKAPQALRAAGLIELLEAHNIRVSDQGDVAGFRWKVDREHPRGMNAGIVAGVANAVAEKVQASFHEYEKILVIGGDCTVELGVIAGCLHRSENIGLVYIDLDTDLNTPHSVEDGAFDWMGVAHLLNIEGTEKKLASLGKRIPMLHPAQVHFFANGNMTGFEKAVIHQHNIAETPVREVEADPAGTAGKICNGWARSFDHLLIHLDVDVLDYVDMPLAENYRRNQGLKFDQLMLALGEFLKTPNWRVLTITEINPDHGENDGSTLRMFSERLAKVLGKAFNAPD